MRDQTDVPIDGITTSSVFQSHSFRNEMNSSDIGEQLSKVESCEFGEPRGPPISQNWNLYVASLPPDCTDADLLQLFSPFGAITSAKAMRKKEQQECKGYGFVLFQREEDAEKAQSQMIGYVFRGNKIQVRRARPTACAAFNDHYNPRTENSHSTENSVSCTAYPLGSIMEPSMSYAGSYSCSTPLHIPGQMDPPFLNVVPQPPLGVTYPAVLIAAVEPQYTYVPSQWLMQPSPEQPTYTMDGLMGNAIPRFNVENRN